MRGDSVKVIHVNFSSAVVDPVYFPQIEVVGDIANSIWRIKERLVTQGHWDFDHFRAVQQRLSAHILDGSNDERFPMYPQRVVADVRRVMPDDGIIALDNGVYKIWFARNYRAQLPKQHALRRCEGQRPGPGRGALRHRGHDRAASAGHPRPVGLRAHVT
jgi:acetolactate synthase I/II/III large subunit